MVPELPSELARVPPLGVGQTLLRPLEQIHIPSEENLSLYRLSDPALSELGVEELLDTRLLRVRDALAVDTVATSRFPTGSTSAAFDASVATRENPSKFPERPLFEVRLDCRIWA